METETPIANPLDYDFKGSRTVLYLFRFGAVGTQAVYAWGNDGLEDALEEATGWLKDQGKIGYFNEPDYKDAAADLGIDFPRDPESVFGPLTSEEEEAIMSRAETDMTYTESGWLLSWEWFVDEVSDPTEVAEVRDRSVAIVEDLYPSS